MFNHRFDPNINRFIAWHWFLLSFNGGAINSGGFLATGKFVSHITGFATLFGVDLVNDRISVALGILSVPLFFLLGSFIAGLLIDRPIYHNEKPHFDWVMGLSALCLFLAVGGGEFLHFGEFGDSFKLKENYLLLVLLCLASGLQNGAITSSSGGSVRTTHLTGLTTDLGLGLARIFTFNLKAEKVQKEIKANYLRIGSITSFILGSSVGAFIFMKFGYKGFILPAMIASYASLHGRKAKIEIHKS